MGVALVQAGDKLVVLEIMSADVCMVSMTVGQPAEPYQMEKTQRPVCALGGNLAWPYNPNQWTLTLPPGCYFSCPQTGFDEEPELHWKADKQASLEPCRQLRHVFLRTARDCPDVIFLQLSVRPAGQLRQASHWGARVAQGVLPRLGRAICGAHGSLTAGRLQAAALMKLSARLHIT